MHTKTLLSKIKRSSKQQKRLRILFVIVFIALVGTLVLAFSKAATFSVSMEPESSPSRQNVEVIDDSSASNGKYIKFGTTVTPPPSNGEFKTCYPDAFCNSNNQPVVMHGVNLRDFGKSTSYSTTYVNRAQLQKIKDKGFNSIRVAMDWPSFQPSLGSTSFSQQKFDWLRALVDNCKSVGLYVILDPIHSTGENGRIGEINSKAKNYIQKVANEYKNESTVVAIDLANEVQPVPYSDDAQLISMYNRLINYVREVDQDKILMIEPQSGDKLQSANALASGISNKSNIIFSYHDYYAGNHNSSGGQISGCNTNGYNNSGNRCGNEAYENRPGYVYPRIADLEAHILANVNMLADSRLRFPLYIGEYGIIEGGANASQWRKDVTQLYNRYRLSRALWLFYNQGGSGGQNPPNTEMSATYRASDNSPAGWKPWVNDYF